MILNNNNVNNSDNNSDNDNNDNHNDKNNDNNNNNNLYIPDGFCLCKGYQAIRLSAWPA